MSFSSPALGEEEPQKFIFLVYGTRDDKLGFQGTGWINMQTMLHLCWITFGITGVKKKGNCIFNIHFKFH